MNNFDEVKVNRGKKGAIGIIILFGIYMAILLIDEFLSSGVILIAPVIGGVLSLVLYLFYKGNKKAYFLVKVMVGYGIWNIFFILLGEGSRKLGFLNEIGKLEVNQVVNRFTLLMIISIIPAYWVVTTSRIMKDVKVFVNYQRERR